MIKNIIKIFLALLFLITKKIFIKENRVAHKLMDNFSNKIHSIFIFTSFPILYLLWFDIKINLISINLFLYILLFLQFVIVIRYFNPNMLKVKELQTKIINNISKFSLVIFIFNWTFLTFGFSVIFLIFTLVNKAFYVFIIHQVNKQKEQEEFKKQFGEGNYTKDDIVKKHILNLFEENLDIAQLTKIKIKKQYRLMAKEYHPDVYKGNEQDKFTSINLSYQFLMDFVVA